MLKKKSIKTEFPILNAELPMSNAMYAMLVSRYAGTIDRCCSCSHFNGECGEFAKKGRCRAMDVSINKILVFNTGETEFATTRYKIAKALEYLHQSGCGSSMPETVDGVIEDYIQAGEIGNQDAFAMILYERLCDDVFGGIIYEINYKD